MGVAIDTYGHQGINPSFKAYVEGAVWPKKSTIKKFITATASNTFVLKPYVAPDKLDFLDGLFPQEKPVPTTQLQSEYAPLGLIISFVRNHLKVPYSSKLADRLDYLHEASIEEAPEQSPISVDSLQGFINFLKKEQNLGEPDVVLSYEGNIRAEWHKSRREHFAVEFLPDCQVRYVIFSSDPDYPSRTNRVSGLVSAETLMKKAEPFNVLSWATR